MSWRRESGVFQQYRPIAVARASPRLRPLLPQTRRSQYRVLVILVLPDPRLQWNPRKASYYSALKEQFKVTVWHRTQSTRRVVHYHGSAVRPCPITLAIS